MKTSIVQQTNPILRETAAPVALKDIGSKKVEMVIKKMQKSLHEEDDGVAIAAPQIAVGMRIFVVSGSILKTLNRKTRPKAEKDEDMPDEVYINPEMIRISKKKKLMDEGCLSVRWLYGQVERAEKVTIRAYTREGKKIEKGASGLLAQIFQHEMDHLDGVLFIDKAKNVVDRPPEGEDYE
jgi:peptide deformylase